MVDIVGREQGQRPQSADLREFAPAAREFAKLPPMGTSAPKLAQVPLKFGA
jgi:hypothetical protein